MAETLHQPEVVNLRDQLTTRNHGLARGMLKVLVVEDNHDDFELIEHELKSAGIQFTSRLAQTAEEFTRELAAFNPDIIISDFSLPAFSALEALDILKHSSTDAGFILVTGSQSEEVAVDCIKRGADDYLLKQSLTRLPSAVLSVMEKKEVVWDKEDAEQRLSISNRQLRALSAHIQSVREEERTRIAREIHDELGQILTGIRLDLSWVEGKLSRTPRFDLTAVTTQVKAISGLVDSAVQTVRRIATELRPRILDDLGLVPALEWQIGEFEQRTNIQCTFKTNVEDVDLNADRATALFRILQESLTNVVRHAHATSVQVSLTVSGGRIELTIHDNGKGITEVEISDQHSSLTELEEQYPKSLGILGMSERAGLLGGTVVIKGITGEGTTVTVELPVLTGAVT